MDSTWYPFQFKDKRIGGSYNLIAFDGRNCGRSTSPLTPRRDAWVEAADIGAALALLGVSQCHVFASQMISVNTAYRFALLFPDMTLSLCLCQIPATVDMDWAPQAYQELLESWCFPPDVETVERACLELGYLMFGGAGVMPEALTDDVYELWQITFPATKRTKLLESALTCLQRQTLTDKMCSRLKLPVLIMHGDQYIVNPLDQAEAQANRLPNSQFFVVKGAPEAFTMVPSFATIVNRVYSTFLSRHPQPSTLAFHRKRKFRRTEAEVLTVALQQLADIFEDPTIARRSPTPLSFCMKSQEQIAESAALMKQFEHDEVNAVTALGRDGKPRRRLSTRHEDQWTQEAFEEIAQRSRGASVSSQRGGIMA